MSERVIVIGAGINGLVAANYLRRAGLAVTMIERSGRVGGACVSELATVDGHAQRYALGASVLGLMQEFVFRETGLAGRESVLWLYRETLTMTAREETVATYTVRTGRVPSQFESVTDPVFYPSQLRPHQQTLGDLPESAWRCVAVRLTRAVRRWRRRPVPDDHQLTLPLLDEPSAVA